MENRSEMLKKTTNQPKLPKNGHTGKNFRLKIKKWKVEQETKAPRNGPKWSEKRKGDSRKE